MISYKPIRDENPGSPIRRFLYGTETGLQIGLNRFRLLCCNFIADGLHAHCLPSGIKWRTT